ncbi:hypothetical protein FOL47_004334 [Perkinsus chesapeaki]|uniref:N-acetyltransferase domain-containing protein n=1 Tax=Perkinsus chesapeaki TaxID=330153 RepID=A0A7J6M385_PERCH|nr:hypothetical protein FOL47_004334 [Perkinsus chesapeaki]
MKLNLYIALVIIPPVTGEINYRDYKDGDKFLYQVCFYACRNKEGIPCYVGIDDKINKIVGCMGMDIPYPLPKEKEEAVRKKMPNPKKAGIFGNIGLVDVSQQYRKQGIGSRPVQHSIDKGRTTSNTLAMVLDVNKNHEAAIALYEKLKFVQVMLEGDYYTMAYYY